MSPSPFARPAPGLPGTRGAPRLAGPALLTALTLTSLSGVPSASAHAHPDATPTRCR
jgi:hypothetical protein